MSKKIKSLVATFGPRGSSVHAWHPYVSIWVLQLTIRLRGLSQFAELFLATCRLLHRYMFIYKAMLGLFPTYLCVFIKRSSTGQSPSHSQDLFILHSKSPDRNWKKELLGFAPAAWNLLQRAFKVQELVSLSEFKCKLKVSMLIG